MWVKEKKGHFTQWATVVLDILTCFSRSGSKEQILGNIVLLSVGTCLCQNPYWLSALGFLSLYIMYCDCKELQCKLHISLSICVLPLNTAWCDWMIHWNKENNKIHYSFYWWVFCSTAAVLQYVLLHFPYDVSIGLYGDLFIKILNYECIS